MATTNIPAATADDTKTARDEAVERAKANQSQGVSGGVSAKPKDDEGVGDLDKQARAAVTERAHAFFDSTSAGARVRLNAELATADDQTRERRMKEFQGHADTERQRVVDEAMAVYEDAIKRRGARQAAMDQMQGAVGLPADPKRRQIEIEKRIKEGDAAMQAQSGVGTVADNLEGRLLGTRIDTYFGDAGRAEFNPHVQEGHGQNVAAMAQASARLQQIAPEAPMTPENVNDPHGAKDRMERDRAKQSDEKSKAHVSGDVRSSNPPVEQRIDQQGKPGGHPATEGGLQASDPLLPNVASGPQPDTNPANQPKIDAGAQPGAQQGLTAEQRAQRDKLAGGSDPS